ncbi:MAG: spermidine/putrescine ABC transporter substrate-binding protein [Rhodospirillaceae bacterium]|nr:spermidine/putrescine ABC transporter substrate-binding protein [Rhodospirillaceae bacterium]
MKQMEFNRRVLLQSATAMAAIGAAGGLNMGSAQAAGPLKLWTIGIAKVGAKDWSAMAGQAGIEIAYNAKSARADEAIQKMVVGDGSKLYDAMSDNGGGMEDALASQGAVVELDTSKIPNWKNTLPIYNPGGAAAETIRHKGKVVAVPYISNADSLAYNYDKIGADIDSWEAMFDAQFKGRAAMQNDFGPTLTNTAIYLKESGKQDIDNPSNMNPSEVKGVCQFLIAQKKKGQFRTFWDGFGNGLNLLASEEVLVSSCWEPIQIVAAKKSKMDIRYGTMKEGHQTWNNAFMLTKGGQARGQSDAFYKLMNVYLSTWFGARTLATFGFGPQMQGVNEYVEANPKDFDAKTKALLAARLAGKADRYAVKGNSWQNVFPTHIRDYQDWWARVQAA